MTLLFSREMRPGSEQQSAQPPLKERLTREERELSAAKRREQIIDAALEEMQKQMDLIRGAIKDG